MNFLFARRHGAALLAFCLLGVVGCSPPPGSATVSPVERYLKSGQARAQQNDFDGALAAYEKALAIDMNNPAVHYQLALLFDTELNQPTKALYHFTRVLEINPDYRWSDMIKDRLPTLRMRVSSGSIPTVPCAELEIQISQLHRDLSSKNDELQLQANQIEELRQRFQAMNSAPARTPQQQQQQQQQQPVRSQNLTLAQEAQRQAVSQQRQQQASREPEYRPPVPAQTTETPKLQYTPPKRIAYTVLGGDTLYSLGRRYGIDYSEILKMNPGLTADSLKIGDTIVIPVQ